MKKISVLNLIITMATAITSTKEKIAAASGDPEKSFMTNPQRGIGSRAARFSRPGGEIRSLLHKPRAASIISITGPAPDPLKNLIIISGF